MEEEEEKKKEEEKEKKKKKKNLACDVVYSCKSSLTFRSHIFAVYNLLSDCVDYSSILEVGTIHSSELPNRLLGAKFFIVTAAVRLC
jgi:hypothetical protein